MTCRAAITATLKATSLTVCVNPDAYRVSWIGLWLAGGFPSPPDTFYSILTTPQGDTLLSTSDQPLALPEGQ